MHARSALFDLYGDHLRDRGGTAPVAALVQLLAPLGVQAPAVRTAVSRMVRQGWLEPARIDGQPGYTITERARRRLDDAAARIYRTGDDAGWDRHWHLAVLQTVPDRRRRDRLGSELGFLGWVPLSDSTWVGLRDDEEVDAVLATEQLVADRFSAAVENGAAEFARRVWRLDELGAAYDDWLRAARKLVGAADESGDEQAFAVRSQLVHEWRKFLFRDPGLPADLLPAGWAGTRAAEYFDDHADRLATAAGRFVDRCLSATPV